jgi:hypothetical protein
VLGGGADGQVLQRKQSALLESLVADANQAMAAQSGDAAFLADR